MSPSELVILLFLLVLIGLYVWALVVCGMKGRWVLFVLGILLGIFAIVGAFLPAKPGSSWARKRAVDA